MINSGNKIAAAKIVLTLAMLFSLLAGQRVCASSGDDIRDQLLTRSAFVNSTIQHDPTFVQDLQDYLSATYNTLTRQAVRDWVLAGDVNYERGTEPSGLLIGNQNTEAFSYGVGVEKLFLNSGTRINLTHEQNLSTGRLNTATLETTRSSETKVALSITQPLIKNAFGLADRFPIQSARLQAQAAYLDVLEAWENRVLALEKIYLDWMMANQTKLAYQAIVADLETLVRQIKEKYRLRVADEKDLIQAESNLLNYQNRLLQASTNLTNQSLLIAVLSRPAIDWQQLNKITVLPDRPAVLNHTDQVAEIGSVDELRLLGKLKLLKQEQELAKNVAQQSITPAVDLTGRYALQGEDDQIGESYRKLGQNYEVSLGLQAALPLGASAARGELGQADAALEKIQATTDLSRRTLKVTLDQLRTQIISNKQVLMIQNQLVEKSQKNLELEKEDYAIGRRDISYLIDAQNNLTTAKLAVIRQTIELEQLRLDYLAMSDQLLTNYPALLQRINKHQ